MCSWPLTSRKSVCTQISFSGASIVCWGLMVTAVQITGQLCQVVDRDDFEVGDEGSFGGIAGGHEDASLKFCWRARAAIGSTPPYMAVRCHPAKLTQYHAGFQTFHRDFGHHGQHAQRHGQVVGRPLFADVWPAPG